MIATLRDLDVSVMARGGQYARRQVVVEIRGRGVRAAVVATAMGPTFAETGDEVQFVGADEGIHLRDVPADIAAIALHQASGHDQLPGAADLLVFGHFKDGIHGLLLGGIDEAARC
jgi:hypothetical protein